MKQKFLSNDLISYIEENLTNKLNLEEISMYKNYSKYHFQRHFLSEIGISPADYVNRRRIIKSTYLITMSNLTITEIAFQVGFNNIDTFIRNFKKQYGITPTEYLRKHQNDNLLKKREKKIMNIDLNLLRNCKKEDKFRGLNCIEKIVDISKKAHKSGLLSISEINGISDSLFLKKGIDLMLAGVDRSILRETLTNYITLDDLTPGELLEKVIYMEGILKIQNGEYPWAIIEYLNSYLGEDFIEIIQDKFFNSYEQKHIISVLIEREVINLKIPSLSNDLKKMKERSLQRFLRECDTLLLAISLYGLNRTLKELVIKLLFDSQRIALAEMLKLMDEPNLTMVVDAQNELIKVLNTLRVEGEVV